MEILARRYDSSEPVKITIADGEIAKIESQGSPGEHLDWPFVAPGIFDHQINGFGGVWFSDEDLTAEATAETLEKHFQYGITRMCPTLITNSFEALAGGFRALRAACEQETWVDQMVPGFHLEGPFIASEDGPRGAHPLQHVRPADWDEFCRLQEIADGRIRILTIAPESAGAIELINKAVNSGVTISIGHTGASPEQVRAAVDAGASMSTHLGNGAHGTMRRHPNYIWEQLGDDRLASGIITDGHHLPASVVRTVIKTKGIEKTFITCDASGLAGCKPGRYEYHGVEVEVLANGPIVLAGQNQLLAGSGQETDICVANAMTMADVSLAEALDMAGRYPAKHLGFEEIALREMSRADLIVFQHQGRGHRLEFLATLLAGEVKYGEIPVIG